MVLICPSLIAALECVTPCALNHPGFFGARQRCLLSPINPTRLIFFLAQGYTDNIPLPPPGGPMPERKIVYEPLEHTADTGFLVKAPSLERLYIDAGHALTDQVTRLENIKEKERRTIEVDANDKESLMVGWLNEILFLFEKHKFLPKRIVFNKFDGKKIVATLWGETHEPTRHGHVSEIKILTNHQLEVGEGALPEPHFFAKVFLDL